MTDQLGDANELARRFVACKGWRWLPGMLAQSESQGVARVFHVATDGWISLCGGQPFGSPFHTKTPQFPILSDAATRGAILQLVRVAWGDPDTGIYKHGRRWCVIMGGRCEDFFADTEAQALLAALEAAKAGE
tara:strand:- start:57 stop:455 length:399 start_codon:yes stop_codon:yes gene_type:complete